MVGKHMIEQSSSPHSRGEDKELEINHTLQRHAPSDLIPLGRPYLLVSTTC
jgi:hypothetical protein